MPTQPRRWPALPLTSSRTNHRPRPCPKGLRPHPGHPGRAPGHPGLSTVKPGFWESCQKPTVASGYAGQPGGKVGCAESWSRTLTPEPVPAPTRTDSRHGAASLRHAEHATRRRALPTGYQQQSPTRERKRSSLSSRSHSGSGHATQPAGLERLPHVSQPKSSPFSTGELLPAGGFGRSQV